MPQLLQELRCAEAIAREAGRRIISQRRAGFSVHFKAVNDVVTDVDRSIETFITEELRAIFPDDRFHGEEHGKSTPSAKKAAQRTWLIDPIDGTVNFTYGIPIYCVSIGLQIDGQTQVGVIYEPTHDELFSARLGHGAKLDGADMAVTSAHTIAESLLVTGFPAQRTHEFERTLQQFSDLTRASRGVRRLGSAAIDLAYVAAGRLDGFWEFGLSPWDTAAGYLLVSEAGGRVTTIEAGPYSGHEASIVATNGLIHDAILDVLNQAV